jgi:hypothetical protein
VGAFAAALSSKSIAMTLPLTLLLLDVYPLRRRGLGWWVLAREKLPYAMLAAAAGVVAFVARQESGNITAYAQYGVGARLALAAHTLWFSWWKSLWPAGLSPMYELPQRVDLGQGRFLGAVLAVAALTATLVLLRRRWPAGLAAWAQSVIVLVPISGVVHSGNQLAADRYSYLSGIGLAILAGAGCLERCGTPRPAAPALDASPSGVGGRRAGRGERSERPRERNRRSGRTPRRLWRRPSRSIRPAPSARAISAGWWRVRGASQRPRRTCDDAITLSIAWPGTRTWAIMLAQSRP